MNKFTKNSFDLDARLMPSSMVNWLSYGVMAFVFLICLAVDLVLWQWILIALCVLALMAHLNFHRQHQPSHISTDQIDGIWLLALPQRSRADDGVFWRIASRHRLKNHLQNHPQNHLQSHPPPDDQSQCNPLQNHSGHSPIHSPKDFVIHQAYLHGIQAVPLGITWALVLDFYVILPSKRRLDVVIFKDQLSASDFAKLMALARLSR